MNMTNLFYFFFFLLLLFAINSPSSTFAAFRCKSPSTCNSLVDYVSPNETTLSSIQTLFTLPNFSSILAANNLPSFTSRNHTVASKETIKIPFPCICANATGISQGIPFYTVVSGDGLYHIAADVFSNLVTVQQIQAVNNISDPNVILAGQNLSIPLPCSCDDVDGQKVVHYGHVVPDGATVEGIAQQFNTSQNTLLSLNNLTSSKDLMAGAILDVPLRVCSSNINNRSLDYPLLVPNATYAVTASNCVVCKCDATVDWKLQCIPNIGVNTSCSLKPCEGADNLNLGNSISSGCNRTTCDYAGYTNQTILTVLDLDLTCPAGTGGNSSAQRLQGWMHMLLFLFFVCMSV